MHALGAADGGCDAGDSIRVGKSSKRLNQGHVHQDVLRSWRAATDAPPGLRVLSSPPAAVQPAPTVSASVEPAAS